MERYLQTLKEAMTMPFSDENVDNNSAKLALADKILSLDDEAIALIDMLIKQQNVYYVYTNVNPLNSDDNFCYIGSVNRNRMKYSGYSYLEERLTKQIGCGNLTVLDTLRDAIHAAYFDEGYPFDEKSIVIDNLSAYETLEASYIMEEYSRK